MSLLPDLSGNPCIVKRVRENADDWYSVAKGVLDKDFCEQIQQKHNLHPRCAELYFAATFIDRCGFDVSHPADHGPDFFLENFKCWAEVVAISDGEDGNPNSIPKIIPGTVQDYPRNQILLRMTSAFCEKSEKIVGYIKNGIVDPSRPVILCISGGGMTHCRASYPAGGLPDIFHAVLPIGELVFQIMPNQSQLTYKYRGSVDKQTKTGHAQINHDFFLVGDHSHISAIVYSSIHAGHERERKQWGNDFWTIHNPMAKNPLPKDFMKCGRESVVSVTDEDFSVKHIR